MKVGGAMACRTTIIGLVLWVLFAPLVAFIMGWSVRGPSVIERSHIAASYHLFDQTPIAVQTTKERAL